MSEGVEWALHTCLNLAWVEDDYPVPAAALADYFKLPPAYLNKQLQALARSGIVSSTSGPRGGFQLARMPEDITVLDVVVAIEGSEEVFRCAEILRDAPDGEMEIDYRSTCVISQVMRKAELAWRKELAGQTLADVKVTVESRFPAVPGQTRHGLRNRRA
ncbi:RrF2 family transcriptional regulator [Nonomuraea turcica]|uniref:RrF2 family transcriptional regulator n=1 Tax=Nonomuraea sp. G32 TaxID=3067274 RepID=UPI00273B881A|nr:Rrf2 family transcriptional regulator [Nonomuraea sp. G32]